VLVLDEPTTGLDAVSKRQVFAELLKAVEDGERTVLISSHGLGDLERFADHIGMIKDGSTLAGRAHGRGGGPVSNGEFFTESGVRLARRDA